MTETHSLVDLVTRIVLVCSLAHTLLPPWEVFADYPRLQKAYKLGLYLLGYIALNGRSTLYKSIGTNNGSQVSAAAKKQNGG